MGLHKGQTNNKSGRPIGARSRKTIEWEQLGEFITEEGARRVMNYLNNIEDDKEFFEKYERLLNYFKPRMQSSSVDANISGLSINPKEWVNSETK